ncbi:MAG: hypothetical protein R2867_36725 [Caldilineaceae bacterium]
MNDWWCWRAAGYYPPLDPPQFAPRQQVFPTELQLAISAAEGEVYYTLRWH